MSTSSAGESIGFPVATNSLMSSPGTTEFTLSGTELGVTSLALNILPSSSNDISDIFGTSPNGTKNAFASTYFKNEANEQSTNLTGGDSVIELVQLPTQDYSYDTSSAETPFVQSQLKGDDRYDLFKFVTLGHGSNYNTEYKISIANVKLGVKTDFPSFSIIIREFSDTDRRPSYLETYNDVSMDPTSPNYISKLIGDMSVTIDANGKIIERGDFPNKSKLVRVVVSPEGTFPNDAGPFGHAAYVNPIFAGSFDADVPSVIFTDKSDENTATSRYKFSGIDLESSMISADNLHYMRPLPKSATTGSNIGFAFDGAGSSGYTLAGNDPETMNKRQFTLAFQGGFDGISPTNVINSGIDISSTNTQGFDLSTSTSKGSLSYSKAIRAISNPDEWDINLIVAPGVIRRLHSGVFDQIVEMCETRQDVMFIGDVTSAEDTILQAIEQADAVDSSFAGTYYPWVKIINSATNKLVPVPPSVLMPAIYAASDAISAEWYAPAGLNRGGIVGAVSVMNRLTKAERNDLQEGKVNPIATFPGDGIVAFGQKTLQESNSALDRINVRRLLIKVKKYIASTSRYLIFEQNTQSTRNKFLNTVNPYLEDIQQRQGLYVFKVVMDGTNNTPDVVDRNIMVGQIYLQPAKSAEFIVLDFNIMSSGASFSA